MFDPTNLSAPTSRRAGACAVTSATFAIALEIYRISQGVLSERRDGGTPYGQR